jgi:hypothetical protein
MGLARAGRSGLGENFWYRPPRSPVRLKERLWRSRRKNILDAFQYGGLVEKAGPGLLVAASALPFLLEIVKELALSGGVFLGIRAPIPQGNA